MALSLAEDMLQGHPAFIPDEIEIVKESKFPLLDEGKPTNSFATNEPKEYPATDSADPVSEDTPSAAESAATIAGAGLAVAAMAENAGGIANAAGDIAAAAVEAMTAQTTAIIAEYAAKFAALPLSIPTGIASKTTERFNKSKGDKNKNGEDYDPIKLSLSDFMSKLGTPVEDQSEESDKKQNEKKKNKAVENAQKKLKKASDSANKILAKSAKVIGDIMTHTLEGAAWIQEQLDKEVSRAVKNVTNELETAYKDVKEDIDTFCENEGDKIGTKLVKQYNNLLEDKAKDIIDKQNKIKTQATVKANAAVQKVKLKLFALIGL